jgi:hypothetical protein
VSIYRGLARAGERSTNGTIYSIAVVADGTRATGINGINGLGDRARVRRSGIRRD